MKLVLVLLFVGLAGYLIIQMCGGFSGRTKRRRKGVRPLDNDHKRLMVLDLLVSLNDRDLAQVKGEILEIKDLLEKGPIPDAPGDAADRNASSRRARNREDAAAIESKLSGKALMRKIRRETGVGTIDIDAEKRPPRMMPRIIVVNILLLLITLLVMLL